MAHTQYSIFPEVLNGVTLRHVAAAPLDPKIEQQAVRAGGMLDVVAMFLASQESSAKINTHDLYTVFHASGLNVHPSAGLVCASDSYFQYQKRAEGGYATGANHARFRSPKGFLHVDSLEAEQDEKKPAMCSLMYHLLRSGSTYIQPLLGQSLTGTPNLAIGYTLGPLYINGVPYDSNVKFRWETGTEYKPSRTAGATTAEQGATHSRAHKMVIDFKELSMHTTWGFSLKRAPGAIVQYLQKIDPDGLRISPSTSAHIAVRFADGMIEPTKIDGGADNDAVSSFAFHLLGGTVTVNAATTIP